MRACKKQCRQDRNRCKQTCQESKCSSGPSAPPIHVCEDTGGSFGPMWCWVNTGSVYPYVKAQDKWDFCKDEHNNGKCKKSCGVCG